MVSLRRAKPLGIYVLVGKPHECFPDFKLGRDEGPLCGEGVPSNMNDYGSRLPVEGEADSVPKRGSGVNGCAELERVSRFGVHHSSSQIVARMSLTMRDGFGNRVSVSSNVVWEVRFCHMCVGRWAPEPHLGVFKVVARPMAVRMCACVFVCEKERGGKGDST